MGPMTMKRSILFVAALLLGSTANTPEEARAVQSADVARWDAPLKAFGIKIA